MGFRGYKLLLIYVQLFFNYDDLLSIFTKPSPRQTVRLWTLSYICTLPGCINQGGGGGGRNRDSSLRGAGGHTCVGVYACKLLETPEKLPHDIVESVVDICNRKPRRSAV